MHNIKIRENSSNSWHRSNTICLKSFVGNRWHNISLDEKTCACEQFQNGQRCEHLNALGIYPIRPFTPTAHPTFSQALSALVKSIRIRRVDEAVYWLVYLDTFRQKEYRFRTARRLLIGSAEDGHSIPVMEETVRNFRKTSRLETDLLCLIADAVRICKLPNWWHPESGGPDYIYQSLVGQRQWLYKRWDHMLKTLQNEVRWAIEERNRAMAIGAVMTFNQLQERFGATAQAEFLLALARIVGHELAARLCEVHLLAKGALSGDNNFICQAAWYLSGGVSPVAEKIEPVTTQECKELLKKAKESWRKPHPIPRWCVDGMHSAGDDPRFAGLLPRMVAVCRAFQFYGRIDPADRWLDSFRCLDGLVIKTENQAGGGK
jgi:hypothetical protein